MMPKKIKRLWTAWAVALLLLTAGVALPILWPCLFPSHYTSDLYRRYEHNDHIRATEIHNFQVNDTLRVDVTLLQASTDSAWYALLRDFGASEELIEWYQSEKESLTVDRKYTTICFLIDKNNSKKRVPLTDPNGYLVIGSVSMRSLCIFLTADKSVQTKKSLYYFTTRHQEIKKIINSSHTTN